MAKKNNAKEKEANLEKNNENTIEDKNIVAEEKGLSSEIEGVKEEARKNYESLQRIMAEFDNYKKRVSKEKEGLYTEITADVMADFLPVIDNLDKALESAEGNNFKDGVTLIQKQFVDVLKAYNVEEIKSLNETFDPKFHESVQHVDDSNYGEKEIVEVFRKGYKIGDKVLRYAMVKVAN